MTASESVPKCQRAIPSLTTALVVLGPLFLRPREAFERDCTVLKYDLHVS